MAKHKTELKSGLAKAISYLPNHSPKLTLFIEQPGALIDDNIVERTLNGAGIGDLFMRLSNT